MRALIPCLAAVGLSCGGSPPQARDEAAITYRASFTAEPGVSAKVTFPHAQDAAALAIESGLAVSDGGTWHLDALQQGLGLTLEGRGHVEASFVGAGVKDLGNAGGVPLARLTRDVPDGGIQERYVQVNKGGTASLQIDFEYTASRDCGATCGGKRSWTYTGPVGLGLQDIQTTFTEVKR